MPGTSPCVSYATSFASGDGHSHARLCAPGANRHVGLRPRIEAGGTRWIRLSPEDAQRHRLYGVRGWLAVFALRPVFGLLLYVGGLNGPLVSSGLDLGTVLMMKRPEADFLRMLITIQTLWVGVLFALLWVKPHTFRPLATGMLLAEWPVVVLIALWHPFPTLGIGLIQTFGPWVVSCAIWGPYLHRSRHVRVTFEHLVPMADRTTSPVSKLT